MQVTVWKWACFVELRRFYTFSNWLQTNSVFKAPESVGYFFLMYPPPIWRPVGGLVQHFVCLPYYGPSWLLQKERNANNYKGTCGRWLEKWAKVGVFHILWSIQADTATASVGWVWFSQRRTFVDLKPLEWLLASLARSRRPSSADTKRSSLSDAIAAATTSVIF